MLIIVEGVDGAGKSTFISALIDRIMQNPCEEQVVALHAGPPKLHPLHEYVTPLVSYRPERGETIICDRWHWGEWIYPSVLNRSTQFDKAVSRYTELFLMSRGAVVVFLDAPADVIRARLRNRGDDLIRTGQVSSLVKNYRHVYRIQSHLPTFRIPDVNISETIVDGVINFARRTELYARRLNHMVTYVGSASPRYLLFGERRNIIENHQPPAFMPFPATSGHYLLTHYHARVNDHGVGLVNACDVDDPIRVWNDLDRPVTVALGKEACARLCANGVPHGVAPHPQFVRRFHNRDGARYCQMINDALYGQIDLSRWDDGTSD